jgi:hypothetical protein
LWERKEVDGKRKIGIGERTIRKKKHKRQYQEIEAIIKGEKDREK